MEAIIVSNRVGVVRNPYEVLHCSFIVQNTLSPLNLNVCKVFDERYIYTEEMVRKEYSSHWNLLYRYGLDLPTSRMESLRSNFQNSEIRNIPNVSKFVLKQIKVEPFVYNRFMNGYILWNILRADNEAKNLRRHLNVIKLFFADRIPFHVSRDCLYFFFSSCLRILGAIRFDSELILDFIKNCKRGFVELVCHCLSSNIMEHILRSLSYFKYTPCDSEIDLDPINAAIIYNAVHNIKPLLKFGWEPKYSKLLLDEYVSCVNGEADINIDEYVYNIDDYSLKRKILIFQVIHMKFLYENNPHLNIPKILRLLWQSIPEPILVDKEFKLYLSEMCSDDEVKFIVKFYKESIFKVELSIEDIESGDIFNNEYEQVNMGKAIEEIHNNHGPRKGPFGEPTTLKQLTRVKIRKILRQNYQLPYGISQLPLPNILQEYLHLLN